MNETLKMMKQFILGYERSMTVEELVNLYKQNESPNILAYLFVDNFGMISQISNQFTMLNDEDKSSYILQELYNAIYSYQATKNTSFITYFYACLKNRLRSENQNQFHGVRYANFITEDLSDYCNEIVGQIGVDFLDLDSCNLTNKEMTQVNMILDGYTNKEIAKVFNVSPSYVTRMNRNLQKKLANLV